MFYYKIVVEKNIVGAITETDFVFYQPEHKLLHPCNVQIGQYALFGENFYRDDWLKEDPENKISYIQANIKRIDEEEYNSLIEAFQESESEIIPILEPEEPQEEPTPEPEDNSLEFVKESKITAMSNACRNAIISGIDVVLSDGKSHHFSLQIEDQIKIQALALKAQQGETLLPWHEDDKPCCFYSAEDIILIYQQLELTQTFHTTYFNSLKMYINSLEDVAEVGAVYYGMEIPEEYQSEVLKYLYSQMAGE